MKPGSHTCCSGFRKHGFTLVELQVALLLIAMIAILLAGALRASVQAWDKSTQHQDLSEHRYLVGQFLRRHMEDMRFKRVRDQEQKILVSFVGNKNSIHYLAPHPAFGDDGELYLWSLENLWNEEERKEQLALKFVPYKPEVTIEFDDVEGMKIADAEPAHLIISNNLLIEGFRYYTRGGQDLEKWHSKLEAGSTAPKVIEMTLKEVNTSRGPPRLTELAVSPSLNQQDFVAIKEN